MIRTVFRTALLAASLSVAHAADWTVNTAHSTIGFTDTQTGKPFTGHFARYTATINFDPAHVEAAQITVTIDPSSATTGDQQRDTALPGRDWFNVAQFPKAVFQSKSVHKTGPNSFVADGTLTMRDITKPVSLPFTLDITGTTAHAQGHLNLTRTLFGIGQGPWASGQWVGLDVGVTIDLQAQSGH